MSEGKAYHNVAFFNKCIHLIRTTPKCSSSNRNLNDLQENKAKRHNDLMDVLETCKHMDGKHLLNLQVHFVKVMIVLYENDDSFVSQEKDLKKDIKKIAVRKTFFVHTTPFRALPISR